MKQKKGIVKLNKNLETKRSVWGGAQQLMNKPTVGSKDDKARQLILLASRALRISPFGINILGDVPYINKLGLKTKQENYAPNDKIVYNWIQYAKDDAEKAICAAKVMNGNKEKSDWVVGECSPSSMGMSTLKGYQNHMAQTRARNRVILEVYGVRIHEDMMEQIQRLTQTKAMTEQQASLIAGGAGSTAEEVQVDKIAQRSNELKVDKNLVDLKAYAVKCGAEQGKEQEFIAKTLGINVDIANLQPAEMIKLKTQLMAKRSK